MNKDSLVIWINGGFGVGKSETANALAQMDQGSHIYDPESVGYFLWHVFPPEMSRKGDFQDIPLWRSINLQVLHYLWQNHKGDIVVPMTISERRYYDEIIGETKPLEIFDPDYTWKRKILTDFRAVELQKPVFIGGKCVYPRYTTDQIRDYCAAQLELQWDEVKRFENPHNYYVDLSQKLWDTKQKLLNENSIL